jgi:hypothetical protein
MRFLSVQLGNSCFLLAAVTILSWTPAAGAPKMMRPPAKSQFHAGQQVEFEHFGRILTGEVVGSNSFGWIRIRFTDDGHERAQEFPPDKVWLPKKKATAKATGQAKAPIRTWADNSGLYKIEARFVELKDGKVTLEKEDGSTKTLPLDKLSEEDQAAAKKLAEKTPPANPFEGSDNAESSAKEPEGEPRNDEDIIAPAGDWSSVRNIVVDVSARGQFVPDAAGGEQLKQMRTVMMDLTKGAANRDFTREKLAGFFYDRPRQRLLVASTNDELREGRRGPRLEACDLKTGKSLGAVVLDTGIIPCDLSPDGTSVLCMPTEHVAAFHKQRGIEVWRMESGGKLAKRWDPNDTRGKEEMFRVDHGMFVARDLLLSTNTWAGKATAWDIGSAKAVYTLPVDAHALPALSVNRRQLAVVCSGVVCVLDAATGQTLLALTGTSGGSKAASAQTRGGSRFGVRFAFRPDGCQLAVAHTAGLQIWDLQKQALVQEIWLPQSPGRGAPEVVEWVDNDHLLVNGADLIDIPKRIVLWHYEVAGQAKTLGNVVSGHLGFGYSEADRGRSGLRAGIFFLALPHPDAVQAAAGLTAEKLLVLKPGAQVALDLRVPAADAQDVEALTTSYTEQLKAHHISIDPAAPLTFQATVEAGKTDSQTYHTIGRFGSETVNFTRQKCRLALMDSGKVLWERATEVGAPGMMMSHKEGETLQAAVDKQCQQSVMNFFRNITLPGSLARQGEHGAYGFSKVTPMGPVAYDPANEPNAPSVGKSRR